MLNEKQDCEVDCHLINPVAELSDKLQNVVFEKDSSSDVSLNSTATTVVHVHKKPETVDIAVETDFIFVDNKKSLDEKIKQNSQLREQCDNLQQAVELLRNEFENCENYWSAKLDEERQMFEQEQKQSSDKLTELLIKIAEYEEQFTSGKLTPIEENELLEKQYTDLEDEYQQFRDKTITELENKDKEIAELQQKLNEFSIKEDKTDAAIQASLLDIRCNDIDFKINNLTNVIESSNIFSSETLPHLWKPPNSTHIQSDSVDSSLIMNNSVQERDYTNPTFVWNNEVPPNISEPSSLKSNSIINIPNETSSACNSLPASISWQPPATAPSPQPHSLTIIPDNSSVNNTNTNSYRVKRSRKHDRNSFSQLRAQKKEQEVQNQFANGNKRFQPKWNNFDLRNGDQTCVVSISSIHHLHRRLHELDQHCRHLQFILKQQQQHSESVMHREYYLFHSVYIYSFISLPY